MKLAETPLGELVALAKSGALDGQQNAAVHAVIARREEDALAEQQWQAHCKWKAAPTVEVRRLSHDWQPEDVMVRWHADAAFDPLEWNGKLVNFCFPPNSALAFVNGELLRALFANLQGGHRGHVRHTRPSTNLDQLGAILADFGLGSVTDFREALVGFGSREQAARWLSNEPDYARKQAIRDGCKDAFDLDPALVSSLAERKAAMKAEAAAISAQNVRAAQDPRGVA